MKTKKPRPPKKFTEAQTIKRGKQDKAVILGKKKKKFKQDPAYAKATHAVARDHPRSTRLDPKPKKSGWTEFFDQWKSGTSMSSLARTLNKRRREIKKAFIKLAGGKDQFAALRAAGAGGSAFGGKRGGGRTKAVVLADDSKVKKLHSNPKWRPEYIYKHVVVKVDLGKEGTRLFPWRELVETIWISPKGNKYVRAKPMERADLLLLIGKEEPGKSQSVWRLIKLERSSVLKKIQQDAALTKRGLKVQRIRKKIKQKKRAAKRAAKSTQK